MHKPATFAINLFAVDNSKVSGALPTQHQVVCEFLWHSMPSYRGSDFLGITNGGNITPIAGSFNGQYSWDEYHVVWKCSASGQITNTQSKTTKKGSSSNQLKNLSEGICMKIPMPTDITSPSYVYPGTAYNDYINIGMGGAVWYCSNACKSISAYKPILSC